MDQTQTRCRARFGSRIFRRPVMAILGIYCLSGFSGADTLAAQSSPPQVAEVEAVGVDVEVTFFPGAPGTLAGGLDVVVRSPSCGEVGRRFVSTSSGSSGATTMISALVPNVLGQVLACGIQYIVRLEDSSGVVGSGLPFRVDLSCNGSFQCDFRLFPWIEIENALTFSPELDQALTLGTGSGDLVSAVLGAFPQLRDEVSTYALHLDGWITSQGVALTNDCLCQWTGSLEQTGPTLLGGVPMFSALACPERPLDSRTGATTLTTAPRCHTLGSGPGDSWVLPGGQVLMMPAFDRCSPPPESPSTSDFRLTFEGQAIAGGDLGYLAEAAIQVGFAFDQQLRNSATVAAHRSSIDPSNLDADSLTLDSGWVPAATATVSVHSMATVSGPGSTGPPPQIGAWVQGHWGIEATNGAMQAMINKKLPGPIGDVFDEGADPEGCIGINQTLED